MQRLRAYLGFNSAFSLLSNSRANRQPHTPCCQSHPLFDVPDPPYPNLHSHCSQDAVPCYIHSTQPTWCWCPLMSSEAHLEAVQEPPNHTVPIQKGIHSGTSTMRWRQQDSSLGDQFYCLPGTSQKACCPLFQSRQGSCFVYHVFSFIWQIELSLSQVQKRNTEKLLYLVSRPSLSGAGDKNRTLKRCSIKPWSSKHLLPSKSTSVV